MVKLFVRFVLRVAPGSIMPWLSVIWPFITGWQNVAPLEEKRNNRKKIVDFEGQWKVVILLIKRFGNIR